MSACPDFAAWEELAQGSGPQSAVESLQRHLAVCAECRTLYENIRRNAHLAGAIKAAWGDASPGDRVGSAPVGTKIGRYEISGFLGAGGMAMVYRATQDNPRRTVALKLMKLGLGSPAALRRFEHEAELLGRLHHPGIAHVYEAGVAQVQGHDQPYFAMELIDGARLTDYAAERNLGTKERVELIARVGEAVHYAHQKGIIHRDLKPSNILIIDESANGKESGAFPLAPSGPSGQHNTKALSMALHWPGATPRPGLTASRPKGGIKLGQPKILDFGIARATDVDIQATTMRTDIGQLVGTIPYMSPEQASGDPNELDLRSDVYSLGVICYELLTGHLPYSLKGKSIPQAVRTIQEDEPTPLSCVNRLFRGDLDTIVSKALEKDKDRRYAAASALVADLRRYLNNEPIAARPPSAAYQFSKFARRNRALVGGVIAVFVMLLLGLAGTGYGLLRATAERNRAVDAERAATTGREQAESVISLLKQMLSSADPEQVKGADYTVRQLLDEYDQGLKGKSIGQPEVEATIRNTIGNAYLGLGLREQAERQLKAALELRREAHGHEHPEVARALCDYAWFLRNNADYAQAERVLHEALTMQRKLMGSNHVEIATTLSRLADVLRNNDRLKDAEQAARDALDMRRQLLGPGHPDVAKDLNSLGWVLLDSEKTEQAIQTLNEAIAILRNLYGDKHPLLANSLFALARAKGVLNDVDGSVRTFQEAVEVARVSLGEKHHDFGEVLGAYGLYLATVGRYEEAEPPLVEALAISRAVHGDWHVCVGSYQHQLGRLYAWSGRASLAESCFRQSAAINAGFRGEEHPWTLSVRLLLAEALISLKKEDEALALAEHAVSNYARLYGERDVGTANAKRVAGLALLSSGKASLAEPLLREAVDVLRQTPGSVPWRPAIAQSALGECLVSLGRYEEAGPLLKSSYEWLTSHKGEHFYETQVARQRMALLRETQSPDLDNVTEPTDMVGTASP